MSWLRAGGITVEGQKLRQYQLTRIARELKHVNPLEVTSVNLADWMSPHNWSREWTALRATHGCGRRWMPAAPKLLEVCTDRGPFAAHRLKAFADL